MNINNISEMVDYIQTRKRTEKKVSLDRMKAFCSICGNPQVGIKYIHVGGTNGKGSVVSFLKNILLKQGFHVGAYISPYVVCFNERISFDGKYISDEEILYFGNLIISKQEDFNRANLPQPTFFEFVTLMAFLYFKSGFTGKLEKSAVIASHNYELYINNDYSQFKKDILYMIGKEDLKRK